MAAGELKLKAGAPVTVPTCCVCHTVTDDGRWCWQFCRPAWICTVCGSESFEQWAYRDGRPPQRPAEGVTA